MIPKYRAWHKADEGMFDVFGFDRNYVYPMTNTEYYPLTPPEIDEVILMQYTGLKDKNGVEIFEGDVLKIINGMTVVDFHYATLYHIEHHLVEVIGNIHENMELLEVGR